MRSSARTKTPSIIISCYFIEYISQGDEPISMILERWEITQNRYQNVQQYVDKVKTHVKKMIWKKKYTLFKSQRILSVELNDYYDLV